MSDATRALVTLDQALPPAARSQSRVRNSASGNDTRDGTQPTSRADRNNGFKQAMKDEASKSHANSPHDNKVPNTDGDRSTSKADGSTPDAVYSVAHQENANLANNEYPAELVSEHSIILASEQPIDVASSRNAGIDSQSSGALSQVNSVSLAGQGPTTVLDSTDSAQQARLVQTAAVQPNTVLQTVPPDAQSPQVEHGAKAAIDLSHAVASASDDVVNSASVSGLPVALSPPKVELAATGARVTAGAFSKGVGSLTQSMLSPLVMRGVSAQATPSAARESDKSFAGYVEAFTAEEQASADYKPLVAQLEGSSNKTPMPATDRVFVSVSARFGSPGWAEQLAERSANLASQNIKHAEIQLNPQDMGPIHIKISMINDQASVTFAAQNAAVREALDATMQRLKDAFDADGLELVQSDVKDQQQSSDQEPSQGGQGRGDTPSDNDDTATSRVAIHVPRSAVDHFV